MTAVPLALHSGNCPVTLEDKVNFAASYGVEIPTHFKSSLSHVIISKPYFKKENEFMSHSGEEKAWEILSELDPKATVTRTGATFNPEKSTYELKCLGQDINVSLNDKEITAASETGKFLLDDLGKYSRLSILSYLTSAKDIPLTGELVRPSDLSGGGIFVRGTHVIPMDLVAEAFGDDKEKIINAAKELGGLRREYGDVSIELLPLRRVPVTVVLWLGDEDFPPKASLLCDSTCTLQVPIDILWSISMMVVKAIMRGEQCGGEGCCSAM